MPKLPGIPHHAAVRALKKVGFRILRQGRHFVMSDGRRNIEFRSSLVAETRELVVCRS
jgi:hypothetical protein